jgi:hypothetical protein
MPWANLMVIGAAHNEDPEKAMTVNAANKKIPIFAINFRFDILISSFLDTNFCVKPIS